MASDSVIDVLLTPTEEVVWAPTVELRYRKVAFGSPLLQQRWGTVGKGPRRFEWRDVPLVYDLDDVHEAGQTAT